MYCRCMLRREWEGRCIMNNFGGVNINIIESCHLQDGELLTRRRWRGKQPSLSNLMCESSDVGESPLHQNAVLCNPHFIAWLFCALQDGSPLITSQSSRQQETLAHVSNTPLSLTLKITESEKPGPNHTKQCGHTMGSSFKWVITIILSVIKRQETNEKWGHLSTGYWPSSCSRQQVHWGQKQMSSELAPGFGKRMRTQDLKDVSRQKRHAKKTGNCGSPGS